jgi:hypothetical protein
MYVVKLLLVDVSAHGPNYVQLIEAASYSSTYVSLVYGADSINGNIHVNRSLLEHSFHSFYAKKKLKFHKCVRSRVARSPKNLMLILENNGQ